MSWHINADYYEACNCEFGCPCNMNGFPSHGNCEAGVVFRVTEGEKDGVDLSGATVVAAVTWPGAIHEGNGSLALFIDAPEEQRGPLISILTAEDPGLPWEILAATITDIHGPFFEPIEIIPGEEGPRIRVGDAFDVTWQVFHDAVSGEPNRPRMVLERGFIWKDAVIGTTSAFTIDADGVTASHPGKNAYLSAVSWSSESRMAPVVAAAS